MKEIHSSSISHPNDSQWDAFVASLHGVWEFAPEVSLDDRIGLSGRRVLMVGDETDEAHRLSHQLTHVGLRLDLVAEEALAADSMRVNAYDIVILMVEGVSESRLQLCEAIADSDASGSKTVFVISDDHSSDGIRRWRRAGAGYCLRNPVDAYVLVTLIANAVEQNYRLPT